MAIQDSNYLPLIDQLVLHCNRVYFVMFVFLFAQELLKPFFKDILMVRESGIPIAQKHCNSHHNDDLKRLAWSGLPGWGVGNRLTTRSNKKKTTVKKSQSIKP